MGYSFGGYSTLGLIVQTNRFKAAVMKTDWGVFGLAGFGQKWCGLRTFGTGTRDSSDGWNSVEFRDIPENFNLRLKKGRNSLFDHPRSEDVAVASFLGDEVFVALRSQARRIREV